MTGWSFLVFTIHVMMDVVGDWLEFLVFIIHVMMDDWLECG